MTETRGPGLEQGEARRRARELGGVAVSARPSAGGGWTTGGWPHEKDVWIVIAPATKHARATVLDDGGDVAGPVRLDDEEA